MHFFNKHSNCQRLQLSKSKEVCLTQQIAHLSVSWKSCISMVDFDETCLIKSKCSLRNANLKYNRASLHSWLFWPVFLQFQNTTRRKHLFSFQSLKLRWKGQSNLHLQSRIYENAHAHVRNIFFASIWLFIANFNHSH